MSEIHEPLSVHEEVIACLNVYREAWLPLRDTAGPSGWEQRAVEPSSQ